MDDDFVRKFEFALAAKGLPQNAGFDGELMFVAGVLVVASTATLEIRAEGRDAVWR